MKRLRYLLDGSTVKGLCRPFLSAGSDRVSADNLVVHSYLVDWDTTVSVDNHLVRSALPADEVEAPTEPGNHDSNGHDVVECVVTAGQTKYPTEQKL